MPSFDVVSEVDRHQLTNAVDQAKRELENRFDLRGSGASLELEELVIKAKAANEFQLKQVVAMLRPRLAARGIDLRSLDLGPIETNLAEARQKVTIKAGIEQVNGKKIQVLIKEAKLKLDTAITGDKVRVSGKKRDDLQEAMAMLKKADLPIPLQFDNFRD